MMEEVYWVDEDEKIVRMVISMPLFTRRDVLCQMKLDPANHTIMMKSVTHEKCPEVKNIIRAQMTDSYSMKVVDGGVLMTELMSFDLGGWMPVSMMNMMMGASLATE